jgi:WhiB family transcriptional regulator, redox-sensing transcriptional regulator
MTMNEALLGWLMTPGAPDGTLTLEDLLRRPPWHQQAACRGAGVDAFVLSPAKGTWSEYNRELCEDCPVRQECLETALANRELQGLWGGTTFDERQRMRRALRRGRVA